MIVVGRMPRRLSLVAISSEERENFGQASAATTVVGASKALSIFCSM